MIKFKTLLTSSRFPITFCTVALFVVTFFTATFIGTSSHAQTTSIAVGEAKTKKPMIILAQPGTTSSELTAQISQIQKTIESDLEFTDQFRVSRPSEGLVSDYTSSGNVKSEGGHIVYEFHFTQVGGGKEILGKRYTSDLQDYKTLAHSIANDIVFDFNVKPR